MGQAFVLSDMPERRCIPIIGCQYICLDDLDTIEDGAVKMVLSCSSAC